jgi:ABC-2 type transport system permease protein
MEKLLGRYYKWWYLISYSFKQSNIRLSATITANFATVLDFAITIYLWLIIDPTRPRITYFFVGFMIQRLIWSQYAFDFANSILKGNFANILLTPIDNFKFWLFREIGSSALRNLVSSMLILFFLPIYFNYLQLPTQNFIILLPVLIFFGFFIDFCVSYLLACIAFWTEDVRPIFYLSTITVKVLTGIAIPFTFLPHPYSTILILNPYSLINYHPMQIYLGKYDNNQTILVLLGGVFWCVILYFLAKLVFRLGLKKNESVGL